MPNHGVSASTLSLCKEFRHSRDGSFSDGLEEKERKVSGFSTSTLGSLFSFWGALEKNDNKKRKGRVYSRTSPLRDFTSFSHTGQFTWSSLGTAKSRPPFLESNMTVAVVIPPTIIIIMRPFSSLKEEEEEEGGPHFAHMRTMPRSLVRSLDRSQFDDALKVAQNTHEAAESSFAHRITNRA